MLSQWQIRPTRQAVAPRLSDITTTAVKNAVEYFFQQEKKKKNLTTLSYHAILQSHPIHLSRNFKENPLS